VRDRLNTALELAARFVSLYSEAESCVIGERSGDISGDTAELAVECDAARDLIAALGMSTYPMSEVEKLRALLSEAAAWFEVLGVHSPGCGYFETAPIDYHGGTCSCGLDRLIRACERASVSLAGA